MNERPEYDIAYSMLAMDEPYARRLITELKKRVRGEQFIFSRKTEDAAEDSDLLRTFGRIFSADSRLVVLLYRPGWGDTPFTFVEQEAIRARGVRSIFVVAMQPPHVPAWYPESEFWADADVYSVPQISAMIEFAMARERGSAASATPPQADARVRQREVPSDVERREEGAAAIATEAEKLFAALAAEAADPARAGQGRAACELTAAACAVTYNQTAVQLKLIRTGPTPHVYAVLTAWVNVSDNARQSLPFGEWRLVRILDENDEWMWEFESALLTSQQLALALMERMVALAHEDRSDPRIVERSIKSSGNGTRA